MRSRARFVPVFVVLSALVCFSGAALPALRAQQPAAPQPQLVLTPAKSSNIYETGETIAWDVVATNPDVAAVNYTLQQNGLKTYKTDRLVLTNGRGRIETSLDRPGAVLLNASVVPPPGADAPAGAARATTPGPGRGAPGTYGAVPGAANAPAADARGGQAAVPPANPARAGGAGAGRGFGGRGGVMAGALVSPGRIQPSSPRPKDFDAWWKAKVTQLHAVPVNAKLTPKEAAKAGVDYHLITMDNINGVHIQGQIAKPSKAGKFPALVILQWAGVYSLPASRVVDRAAEGWLALNIEPHDMPSDQPNEFYTNLTQTTLRNYQAIGQDSRETSYFLQMYLSAYRALDYIASRPDWDGRTLVVQGTSMGGQQSIALAGLHPKVSAVIVMVPSSNDVTAPEHERSAGFPDWARDATAKSNPKILETAQYLDPMNFASKIKVPALVAMGLYDTTSPPVGVWAAINQMKGPVEPLPMVSGHQDVAGSQRPYQLRSVEWLNMLLEGQNPTKKK